MEEYFGARLEELARRCEKGTPGMTGFLNPAEQYEAEKILNRQKSLGKMDGGLSVHFEQEKYGNGGYFFWGGYENAERKRLFTFPAYLFYTAETIGELLPEDAVSAVEIRGSGYVKLGHRDYLGALLNQGIERGSLGDIVVTGDHGAVLFALEPIARLLTEEGSALETVGKDKVRVMRASLPDDFGRDIGFQRISGVVSSERLDCVVALLCSLSREKAKNGILGGAVQLNYTEVTSPDKEIKPNDIISIKGFGRFRIEDFTGRTRKDRLHLAAVKYI